MGLQLGGSLMSAGAAAAEGRQAREIADRNARLTQEAGRYEAMQLRQRGIAANAKATSQLASRGLRATGSTLDIMLDTTVQAEIDARNRQKYADDTAETQRMEGRAAEQRANNRAVASLIGGFSNAFLRIA